MKKKPSNLPKGLTDWPSLPLPKTYEEGQILVEKLGGQEKFREWLIKRETLITLEKNDPFNYGFEPKVWSLADELLEQCDILIIKGGNRSGKTYYAAKRMIQLMYGTDNARVWALQTTESNSIAMQQPYVWLNMPNDWKDAKKTGSIFYVSYTQKNGFSKNTFVGPNGAQCWFRNYSQDIDVVEGAELDYCWCDELVPVEWLETLKYRIVTRSGKLVVTFTPAQGYTPTVAEFMKGARVIKTAKSELAHGQNYPGLKRGEVPLIMKAGPRWPNAMIIFFHSNQNPYNDYDALKRALDGKATIEVLERAYGLATKTEGSIFQKFGEVNIVKKDKVPTEGTRYCVADGAGVKNWFIKWYIIDANGRIFIYREWPDFDTYGEWALPSSNPAGKAGPAQKSAGRSIDEYKRIILESEGWVFDEGNRRWIGDDAETIYTRIIDPRFGALTSPGGESNVTVLTLMEEESSELPALYWDKPPSLKIDQRIQLINQKFEWDMEKALGPLNQPLFYVVEDCQQSIYAFSEYRAISMSDGDRFKEATKDVIDCDGYLLCSDSGFINDKQPACVGGGAY